MTQRIFARILLCARTDMNAPSRNDRHTVTVRASVPAALHARLRHLGVDREVPIAALLVDAIILLLRHNGLGEGLPQQKKVSASPPRA